MLRALYDLVDRLKTWEEERELDGDAAFARICATLDAEYAALPVAASRHGVRTRGCPAPIASTQDAGRAALCARIAELRARCDACAADAAHWAGEAASRAGEAANQAGEAARWSAEAAGLEVALSTATQRLELADQALVAAQRRTEAIEGSRSWRATAGARRLVERAKRLVRRR